MAKTYITLQTRVDQLKDRVNDITNLIGDLSRLNGKTGVYSYNGVGFDSAGVDPDTTLPTGKFKGDSDLSTAILETVYRLDSVDAIIDQDVRAVADVKFNSIHLGTYLDSANNLHINQSSIQRTTGSINIEAASNLVLDAGGGVISFKDDSANRVVFNFGADSQEIDITNNLTFDVQGNMLVDVDGGVIRFADGGTDRIVTRIGATNELDVNGNYTIDATDDITLDADGAQINFADDAVNKFVFNFTADSQEVDVTNNLTLDIQKNLIIDVDGGEVKLQDATVQYGSFTNNSGNLDIQSNNTLAARFTNDDVVFQGKLDAEDSARMKDDFSVGLTTNLGGTLNAHGATTLLSTLDVTDSAKFSDDASVNLTFGVGGNVQFNSDLNVDGVTTLDSATVNGGLAVTGTYGYLTVDQDADITGNLRVSDSSRISNNASISGNVIIGGTLDVTNNIAVNTNKFNVTAASGNTTIAGTLGVTNATTLSSTLDVTGDVAVNTNKFNVTAASGNTTIAGTLDVTGATGIDGDFDIATNKFTVASASGNTAVAGTLGVTGATTLSDTLAVTSDVAVNTNKFNITAATGNTTIAGTLGVTSDVSVNTNKFNITAATGNTTIAGTLGITGALTADAGVNVDNITIDGTEIDLSTGDLTLDVAGDIILDADGGDVIVKDNGTTLMTLQANEIDIPSGNFTLDVAGDITLNADGGDVSLADAGTTFGRFTNSSGNLVIKGGTTTAITLKGANAHFAGPILPDSDLHDANGILKDVAGTDGEMSVAGAIKALDNAISDLTELDSDYFTGSTRNNVLSALNALAGSVVGLSGDFTTNIGALNNLLTDDQSNLVDAINEVHNHTTTDVSEGTNLYHTTARARASISGGDAITYSSSTGVISISSNAITATHLNVDSNGSVGKALVSDGDGSFSFGHRPIAVFDSAGVLLN